MARAAFSQADPRQMGPRSAPSTRFFRSGERPLRILIANQVVRGAHRSISSSLTFSLTSLVTALAATLAVARLSSVEME